MRIACWSSCFRPRVEDCDLLCGERWVVGKMADGAIGEPRRHFPACGDERDRTSFGLRVFVGHQRQRADFTGAVAALAVVLKDRQHIAIERGRAFGLIRCGDMRSSVPYCERRGGENCEDQNLKVAAGYEHRRISYAFGRLGCKGEGILASASRIGDSVWRGKSRSLESGRDRTRRPSFRRSYRDAHRAGRRQRRRTNRAGPR